MSVQISRNYSIPLRIGGIACALLALGNGPVFAQKTRGCQGATLDHAVTDTLTFADNKMPPSISPVKKAGSLAELVVVDCDPGYYYVKYQGHTRAVNRLDVIAGKPLQPPPCTLAQRQDQQRLAANGATDGSICTPTD